MYKIVKVVQLRSPENPDHWCRVGLSLRELAEEQSVVAIGLPFQLDIDPADSEAEEYDVDNWLSGVVSGLLYGLREADIDGSRVLMHCVEGRLAHTELGALADAAMLAIRKLCGTIVGDEKPKPAWTEEPVTRGA